MSIETPTLSGGAPFDGASPPVTPAASPAPSTSAAPSTAPSTAAAPAVSPAPGVDLIATLAALDAAKAEAAKAKALADEHAAKAAALEADATIGKAYREREAKRIDDAAKTLAAEDKAILDALPSLDAKSLFLDRLRVASTRVAVAPPGAGAAPPPSSSAVPDFAAAWGTPAWADAKAKDPKGAAEWLAKASGQDTSVSTLSRMFAAKAPTAKA